MEKKDYCCENMRFDVENKFCPVVYSKRFREFHIKLNQSTGGILLEYCYNCGTRLPSSLREEWFNELEALLNTEVTLDMDARKIPKEFRSDIWWKKRNL